MNRRTEHDIEHRGYIIQPEGYGFYGVYDLHEVHIGSCEGSYTAREIVDDHIRKVYGWFEQTSHLSPLKVRAAALITNEQAEKIIEAGGLEFSGLRFDVLAPNAFQSDASDIAAMTDQDFGPDPDYSDVMRAGEGG